MVEAGGAITCYLELQNETNTADDNVKASGKLSQVELSPESTVPETSTILILLFCFGRKQIPFLLKQVWSTFSVAGYRRKGS